MTRNAQKFRDSVLSWYDEHKRDLPWRARAGEKLSPYHTWLSEVMLQQTTVAAVTPYYHKFLQKWPDIQSLAAAPREEIMQEWAGLGYYSRARNLHACANIVAGDHAGIFPRDIKALKNLPGIGDYTAAAITAIAFQKPATVMDGNIERILARYYKITTPLPKAKTELKALAAQLFETETQRPGDFAQALMDIGAGVCTPKSPRCGLCPLHKTCQGRADGLAETLPAREKQKPKPQKFGHAYWIANDRDEILLHQRPEKGLLAGMIGLPTSEWLRKNQKKNIQDIDLKQKISFTEKGATIRHTFTHFDLELALKTAEIQSFSPPESYFWVPQSELRYMGFPSLFAKALNLFFE